jgi:hypothetical protein
LAAFANGFRLRLKRDACGDFITLGKFGHLYERATRLVGLVLEDTRKGPSVARSLLGRGGTALAAGFRLHRIGDAEAILPFERENAAHGKLAIRLVGAKRQPAYRTTTRALPRFCTRAY